MSVLTKSQMLAAILTFVTTITLWFLEEVGGKFGAKISIIGHAHSFGLGVLDLTDLAYYFLTVFFFLFLTVRVLEAERKSVAKAIGLSLAVTATCLLLYVVLERHPVRWDLTQDRDFALSEQTKQVLEGLGGDIKITAFFRRGEDYDDVFIRRRVDDILREYATHSRRISYRLVDPDLEADAVIQYNVNSDGTVVFESGTRRKEIFKSKLFDYQNVPEKALPQFVGEGLFTNALLNVLGNTPTTLCLLKGHGERSPEDTSPSGLSQFRKYLLNNNYEIKDLSFISTAKVPPECKLLLLATSPKMAALTTPEDHLIRDWVLQGGRVFLLLESMSGAILPETLKALHVVAQTDLVLDPDRHFILGPQFPAPLLTEHPITNGLESMNPILNSASSLSFEGNGGDFVLTPLLTTSDNATGGKDIKGPFTLGLVVGNKKSGEPVAVVVGDADVISNALIQAPGNLDLSLNMVGWLVGDKDQVTIRPRSQRFRNLTLTKGKARFISFFTQFVYPLVVLVVGGLFWFRRRNN